MQILQSIISVISICTFIALCGYGVVQWFKIVFNMFALTKEYKNGINPWYWRTLRAGVNPFKGILNKKLLTEKGLHFRKNYWIASVKFILVVIVGLIAPSTFESIFGINLLPK